MVTFWFFWVIFGVIFGLGVLNLCEIDGWAGIQGEFSLELGGDFISWEKGGRDDGFWLVFRLTLSVVFFSFVNNHGAV